MKLSAIVGRGSRKDFCDIHALLKSGMTLHQMVDCYRKRYDVIDIGHVLRGLSYFEDADAGVSVRMLSGETWRQVKAALVDATVAYALSVK